MPKKKAHPDDEWEDVCAFIDTAKLDELNAKIDTGELTCNVDDPESCENCGS